MAGWGDTNDKPLSDVVMKVTLPIVSDTECKEIPNSSGKEFLDSMICAGYEGGKDSCTVSFFIQIVCYGTLELLVSIFCS